jgi:hypothetical protein
MRSSPSFPPASDAKATAPGLDALIGEVARRHHFVLDRDDPVLVTVTLNELVLRGMVAQLQELTSSAGATIAAAAARERETAKAQACELITAAAGYAEQQLHAAAGSIAAEIQTSLHPASTGGERTASQDGIRRSSQIASWAAGLACFAAALAGLTAIASPLVLPAHPSCPPSANAATAIGAFIAPSPLAALQGHPDGLRWR